MRKTFGVMTQRARSHPLAHLQVLSFRLNEIQFDTTRPRDYYGELEYIPQVSFILAIEKSARLP